MMNGGGNKTHHDHDDDDDDSGEGIEIVKDLSAPSKKAKRSTNTANKAPSSMKNKVGVEVKLSEDQQHSSESAESPRQQQEKVDNEPGASDTDETKPLNVKEEEDDDGDDDVDKKDIDPLLVGNEDDDEEQQGVEVGEKGLDNDDTDDDDEDEDYALPQTSYTLIYTSATLSIPYWSSVSVALLQISLMLLAILDLLPKQGEGVQDNPFGMPPGISGSLRAAQVLGIILIAMTITVKGDLRVGFLWLLEGFDHSYQQQHNPHAGCVGWLLAGILQICVGLLFIFLALLLLLQSTGIIGMVLNFAATEFLTLIDELFFVLSEKGFLGGDLKSACHEIETAEYHPKKLHRVGGNNSGGKKCCPREYRRPMFFAVTLVVLFIPAGFVWSAQLNGDYVCQNIAVRMGHTLPELDLESTTNIPIEGDATSVSNNHSFAGIMYHVDNSGFGNQRAIYEDDQQQYQLLFCAGTSRWTMMRPSNNTPTEEQCQTEEGLLAVSMQTDTYDVLDLNEEQWFVYHIDFNALIPTTDVILFCADCFKQIDQESCQHYILNSLLELL